MKKIISIVAASLLGLATSYAVDYATALKACESFIMDRNSVCVKGVATFGDEKGTYIIKASQVHGVNVAPDGVGLMISENNSRTISSLVQRMKLEAITSITYANGVLTINIDGSKM